MKHECLAATFPLHEHTVFFFNKGDCRCVSFVDIGSMLPEYRFPSGIVLVASSDCFVSLLDSIYFPHMSTSK
jgi:hypothetical protein